MQAVGDPTTPESPDPSAAAPDSLSGSEEHRRAAVRITLVAVIIICAIAAFNAYADPLGSVRSGRYRVTSSPWVDRIYKMERLRGLKKPPDVLLLGSSTTIDMSPTDVQSISGKSAFNAAVNNGSPLDTYLIDSYMHERFGHRAPPVVLGLDVGLLDTVQPNVAIIQDPDLRRQLPLDERIRAYAGIYQPLFDLRRVPISIRALKRGRSKPLPSLDEMFEKDGFPAVERSVLGNVGIGGWDVFGARIHQNIDAGSFPRLDREQLRMFRRFVKLENDNGVVPTVYLTPVHESRLHPERLKSDPNYEYWKDWNIRRREAVKLLKKEQKHHKFRFYDFTNVKSFGGDPEGFDDVLHMNRSNLQLLMRELERRGAYDRTPTS